MHIPTVASNHMIIQKMLILCIRSKFTRIQVVEVYLDIPLRRQIDIFGQVHPKINLAIYVKTVVTFEVDRQFYEAVEQVP